MPDITSSTAVTFSSRYDTEADLLASLRGGLRVKVDEKLQALSERLESLRHISSRLVNLQEMGLEGEEKLIKGAVVSEKPPEEEGKGIMEVVRGFLPKKRKEGKPSKAEPLKKKERGSKTVTQIKRKRGGKKK